MINQAQYARLWQQKRGELPIDIDVQDDWLEMKNLLDTHLPVEKPGAPLWHSTKYKLLYALAGLLAAAAITYFILHHLAQNTNNKPDKIEIKKSGASNKPENLELNNNAGGLNNLTDSSATRSSTENIQGGSDATHGKPGSDDAADKSIANRDDNKVLKPGNNAGLKPGNANAAAIKGKASSNNSTSLTANKTASGKNRSNNGVTPLPTSTGRNSLNRLVTGDKSSPPGARHGARYSNASNSIHSTILLTGPARGRRIPVLNGAGRKVHGATSTDSLTKREPAFIPDIIQRSLLNVNLGINKPHIFNQLSFALWVDENTRMQAMAKLQPTQKPKSIKSAKEKTSNSRFDWGILVGVSQPGSFTAKGKNSNFYGSLPVDVYAGLFTTYNFNTKLAVNLQAKLLTPHQLSGGYNHTNESKKDTNQTLHITDSQKVYTADIPLNLVYNITNNIALKSGAVLSIPVKQANGISTFTTSGARKDSSGYYSTVTTAINNTTFEKKINFSISGGVAFNFNRITLEGTYYRGLQPQKVSSVLGSYASTSNGIQITLGFRLNKKKP